MLCFRRGRLRTNSPATFQGAEDIATTYTGISMRFKRFATSVALGVIAVLALAACGGDASLSSTSPAPSPKPTQIASPEPTSTTTPRFTPLPTPIPEEGTPTATGCPTGRDEGVGLISDLEFGDGRSEFAIGEPISMTLILTNCGDNPTRLFYGDGQRYEFIAEDEQGEEVWRWSHDRAFTQAAGEETIQPEETVAYSEVWEQTGNDGKQVEGGRYKIFGFSIGCGSESAIESGCHFGVGLFISIEATAP